ncbi:MAG TPA: Flp family type IVb pilin [Candidatus Limnocylindrales bacterium]|nr:Flp family type IVb pilin [Candidatus Limnocylindrales bacterium]
MAALRRAVTGRFMTLWRNQAGQGYAEYALILVLIAILSILALTLIGTQLSSELSTIGESV